MATKLNLKIIPFSDFSGVSYINTGNFGDVKKGVYKDRTYAIKLFKDNFIEKSYFENDYKGFERRLRLSELQHENIIKIVYITIIDNRECLVFEYAHFSLYDIISKQQYKKFVNYSFGLGIFWILQISRGLEYLHKFSPPIIHRDLKSPNLLLFGDGRLLKIADFGHASNIHTLMTNCVGTIKWMAPEVITSRNYSEACDIYSLAIIMWEIFTRDCPYSEPSMIYAAMPQLIWLVTQKSIRPGKICSLPPILEQIMETCWATDPSKRLNATYLTIIFTKLTKNYSPIQPLNFNSKVTLYESLSPSHQFEINSEINLNQFNYDSNSHSKVDNTIYGLDYHLLPILPGNSKNSKNLYDLHKKICKNYLHIESNVKEKLTEEIRFENLISLEKEEIMHDKWNWYRSDLKIKFDSKIKEKDFLLRQIFQNQHLYIH